MENASKALMIAGGVLIALIIITMFLLMFNRISNIEKEQEEQTKTEQLASFNAEYEAYNKKIMYGVDVISLINKVAENNEKYKNNDNYKITIIFDGESITSSSSLIGTDVERTLYKCTSIEYNDLGRICKLIIETR